MGNKKTKRNGKISIIIPVYNTEPYLKKCIDSVLGQTYRNFECILIDDGSTDRSPSICDEYAAKDSRVKVIHKKNGGLSSARNSGLEAATGEYLGFIDSDDWAKSTMFETLVTLLEQSKADVATCQMFTSEDYEDKQSVQIKYFKKEEFMELVLVDKLGSQLPKFLFKSHLFNKIYFPLGRLVEDLMTLHKILHHAKLMIMTNQSLYYYFTSRLDNISNTPGNQLKNVIDRSLAFSERYEFAIRHYPHMLKDELLGKAVSYSIGALGLYDQSEVFKDDMDTIKCFLRRNIEEIQKSMIVNRQRKMAVWLIHNYFFAFSVISRVRNLFR